ncbi:uncharacterized protein LOC130892964 isoform X1 [Diorhabda carinulata]|uniref:uncharacterized protein LOC130892964 isoform X1 n=2 Tax=Diorhabda carinulata TaxID=1163345 RepID=UPI0025A28A29|nr:uncharacterized protein LOC130892964 isoform X1 [Diorhabda carinulata]
MTLFVRYGICGAGKIMLFFNSFNNLSFILSIAVVLSSISSTMTAPATEPQWWTNPCSIQTVLLRHGRSPAENQLRIFIKMLETGVNKKLKAIYPHNADSNQTKNCPKVNPVLRLMTKSSNFSQTSHIFYESMVELAKLVHKISAIRVETDVKYNTALRKSMYEEVEANLKSVMCEFNDTLTKFEPIKPKSMRAIKQIRRSMSHGCSYKLNSLTELQDVDVDFFKKMKKFFKQSRRILRQKKRKVFGGKENKKQTKTKNRGKKNLLKHKRTKQQSAS